MRIDAATHFRILAWKYVWIFSTFAIAGLAHITAYEENDPTQKHTTASFRNLQTATVRIRSGSDAASGIIVSKTGLVLTVAHGLKPDTNSATVVFPGGKSCEAKSIIIDREADVALLAMPIDSLENIDWSTVPVPEVVDCIVGELVVASGLPARETDGMKPAVRVGEILASDPMAVRSSCILTSGDSGGPLLNSRGQLIGLHRQIGVGTDSNSHIALPVIRRALEESDQWKPLRVQTRSEPILSSKDLVPSKHVIQAALRSTVEIHRNDTNGESIARVLGTLIDDQHVSTKLSEIVAWPALSCRIADGSTIPATISKSDRTRDLAILKLADAVDAENSITDSSVAFRHPKTLDGEIVFAATAWKTVSPAGIVCRIGYDEPSQPARFGAALQSVGQHVQITELTPNGSAVLAGLQVGDMLLTMEASKLTSLQAVSDLLAIRQPGDWVMIDVERGRQRLEVKTQLQHNPGQQFEKTEFLDGRAGQLSQRRSGFQSVLQHDIAIDPATCGGPLLDSYGRVIGINIARRAREATFAIPIQDVIELAK